MSVSPPSLLSIRGLSVEIDGPAGPVRALDQVDMTMDYGEVVGLVGESGGGKSMIARTLIGLLPSRAHTSGQVAIAGQDVFALSGEALREHRGRGAALCFQTPRSSLSPARSVGQQLIDRLRDHGGHQADAARQEAIALFERVGLGDGERRLEAYPHQLSGGMCQRVMIALALACQPALLLADEPTTGLDVTLTRGILKLIAAQAEPDRRGVLIISHDLAALAEVCDRIVVLETGRVVEEGLTGDILYRPAHAYTRKLVDAVPDVSRARQRAAAKAEQRKPDVPVLDVRDLDVVYHARFTGKGQQALFDVSFTLHQGETLGIVGESGSGKSTLSRAIMGLTRAHSGSIRFNGTDLAGLTRDRLRAMRRHMQMVFQDPVDALNPRMTVEAIIADPLRLTGLSAVERSRRIDEILEEVGLGPDYRRRRPHELSGGQAQRVGLARALAIDPDLVVLDEPTSALDVTVQAQILDLVRRLTARRDRAYVMVSHDLATVRSICDRVLVLSAGRVVEMGETERLFTDPQADKTRELLAAAPRLAAPAPSPHSSPLDEQRPNHAI